MDVRAAPVQPVESGTRSAASLSVLAPVLALLLVVAAARAGADPHGGPLGPRSHVPPGDVTAVGPAGDPARLAFPARALGGPVMTGQELQAARAAGQVGRGLVAVAGLLHNNPLALSCPAIRITFSRTFCRRLLAIFPDDKSVATAVRPAGGPSATPAQPGSTGSSPAHPGPTLPPPLMAQVLPGAPIPAILSSESDLAPWLTGAIPVVAVGHYDDARAPDCRLGREWCGDDFVVEQLIWVDGTWITAAPAADPAIVGVDVSQSGPRAQEIVRRASARDEQILSIAVIGSRLLAIIDPDAGAVVGPDRPGNLWYVRSAARRSAGAWAEVAWAVIDDATGRVLGYTLTAP